MKCFYILRLIKSELPVINNHSNIYFLDLEHYYKAAIKAIITAKPEVIRYYLFAKYKQLINTVQRKDTKQY